MNAPREKGNGVIHAAVKRTKLNDKPADAVPAWVVTFGDMMALLLVFFILLQMFSELKRDHEYQRVITAVKEAFGYSGGIGVLPIDNPPLRSIIEQLEKMALKNYEDTKISQSDTEGIDGPQMRVTKVREGIVFTIGGPSIFDEGSAEISDPARARTAKAFRAAGRSQQQDHCSWPCRAEVSARLTRRGRDLDELSFYRARNAKDVLIEFGLDDRVFRLEAVGTREPVRPRATDPVDVRENRRVEIILTEQLVEEMNTDWLGTDPGRADISVQLTEDVSHGLICREQQAIEHQPPRHRRRARPSASSPRCCS
jgi:chemotaxis protein MotB